MFIAIIRSQLPWVRWIHIEILFIINGDCHSNLQCSYTVAAFVLLSSAHGYAAVTAWCLADMGWIANCATA